MKIKKIYFLAFMGMVACNAEHDLTEKMSVKEWAEVLQNDASFQKYETAYDSLLNYLEYQKQQTKGIGKKFDAVAYRNGIKNVKSQDDYLALVSKCGIVDPKRAYTTTYELAKAQEDFFKKFPTFNRLDRAVQQEIMALVDKDNYSIINKARTPIALP
jgi:hypothetical protein